MPNFVFAYHGGNFDMSPEEGQKHRKVFMEWLGELGDAVVNPGIPFGSTKMVSKDGVADEHPVTGYSIISADDIEAAVAIARNCPYLDIEGRVGVSQVMEMSG